MRALRNTQGITQRDMQTANGTVSEVENGILLPSQSVLDEYGRLCYGNAKKLKELSELYWDAFMVDQQVKDRIVNIQQTAERRKNLVEDFRRIVKHIAVEIGGFSKNSLNAIVALDERTVERLTQEHEHYERFLKNIGISKDWREVLAPQPEFEVKDYPSAEKILDVGFEPEPGWKQPPEAEAT